MIEDNTCKFEGINSTRCGEEVYNDGHCIFHYKGKKDVNEFTRKFLEYLRKEEEIERHISETENPQIWCNGFVFPHGFRLIRKKFSVELLFFEPKFQGLVSFIYATFEKPVRFFNPKFKGPAFFRNTCFESDAEFSHAEFYDNAFFQHATFNGKATFIDSMFKKSAIFDNARFSGATSFEGAKFDGSTTFTDTTFSEDVEFTLARFLSTVSFKDTKFYKVASFKASFFRNCYFEDTEFYGKVDFSHAHFEEDAVFEYIKNNEENQRYSIFACEGDSKVDFRYSVFNQPEKVKFVKIDLSKALFSHSNIENIRFVDVKWCFTGKVIKRKAIYDEIIGEDPYFVAEAYRRLRKNYESNLRYPEAGDFYIGEMEMKRLSATFRGNEVKNKIVKFLFQNFSLTSFYKYFSLYGENYWLSLIWILMTILIFSAVYHYCYGFEQLQAIEASIATFLQYPPNQQNIKLPILLTLSERLAGITFIALFVLALRRRFKR